MASSALVRRTRLAALALSLSASASAGASAHGYHCPSGQYWRPSLRICQNHPYDGRRSMEAARIPGRHSAERSRHGGQVLTTDTRIIPGERTYSGGHLILRYLVQTRVVEKY